MRRGCSSRIAARGPPRGRYRRPHPRVDRSGPRGHQPFERQDGLRAGSGRLGAWRGRGADQRARALEPPTGAVVRRVETTARCQPRWATSSAQPTSLIMAAAPADFRPADPATAKRPRRRRRPHSDRLEPTADILAATRERRKPGSVIVGFALETGDAVPQRARQADAEGARPDRGERRAGGGSGLRGGHQPGHDSRSRWR